MALKVFCLSFISIMMFGVIIITSQPITKHAVRRHVDWESDGSSWIWPSSDEYHHHARHLNSDYHVHNENCGHTLGHHLTTHRHRHYSGHSTAYHRHHPLVYPPLAPIYDPSDLTTEKTTTTTESTSTTTTTTTPTTIKPEILPAPIYEVIDEESDDDKQMPPQSSSTTLQNIPITEINPEVNLSSSTRTSSGIDLRFGA